MQSVFYFHMHSKIQAQIHKKTHTKWKHLVFLLLVPLPSLRAFFPVENKNKKQQQQTIPLLFLFCADFTSSPFLSIYIFFLFFFHLQKPTTCRDVDVVHVNDLMWSDPPSLGAHGACPAPLPLPYLPGLCHYRLLDHGRIRRCQGKARYDIV